MTSSDPDTSPVPPQAARPNPHFHPEAVYPFDARGVAKRFRHAAIFGALEALQAGETMRFINDHDPIPLIRQMATHFGETVAVEYQQRSVEGVVIDFIKQD